MVQRAKLQYQNYITKNIVGVAEIDAGQGELKVGDAGIECRVRSYLILFFGQHKLPFSREELRSASKLLVIDRGEVNEMFGDYGYLGRDIGVSLEGEIGNIKYPAHYALGVFNGSGANLPEDADNDKQYAARITFGPVGDMTVGMNSTLRAEPGTHDARFAYGGDFSFQKKSLTVEGEVLAGQTGPITTMAGGYVAGTYRVGAFEPSVKLERFYPDLDQTGDHRSSVTGNLGWYFNERLRLRTGLVSAFAPGEDPALEIAAQIQVVF